MFWTAIIFFGLLTTCFLCCIVCGYKHLKLAIDVIDASADFLAATKRILLVPGGFFVLQMLSVGLWLGCVGGIYSTGEITPTTFQLKDVVVSDFQWYCLWYTLFAMLWLTAFFEYCSKYVVLASAATYYFDSHAGKEGEANVCLGFNLAFLKHTGSIASGAFVIALIRFIKFVFYYIS